MKTPKQSDLFIDLSLVDDNGDPIDLSAYSGIVVYLYQGSNSVVAKYSKVPAQDFGPITISDPSSGTLRVYLSRSATSSLPQGRIFAEIKVKKADLSGEGGELYSIASGVLVGELSEIVSGSNLIP